eukprot:2109952-Amphidinium_carterae.1
MWRGEDKSLASKQHAQSTTTAFNESQLRKFRNVEHLLSWMRKSPKMPFVANAGLGCMAVWPMFVRSSV